MRTLEDIQKLAEDLKGWFKEEAGVEFNYLDLEDCLLEKKKALYAEFLFKRISHLKLRDYLSLLDVLKKEVILESSPIETKTDAKKKRSVIHS